MLKSIRILTRCFQQASWFVKKKQGGMIFMWLLLVWNCELHDTQTHTYHYWKVMLSKGDFNRNLLFFWFQVTVGASFLSQTIALQDSTTVKFEIWDTAGQERYCIPGQSIINTFDSMSIHVLKITRILQLIQSLSWIFLPISPQLSFFDSHFWSETQLLAVPCRYAALAPLYYRGAAVAVVVYDITSPESFSKAQYWVKVNQHFLFNCLLRGSS